MKRESVLALVSLFVLLLFFTGATEVINSENVDAQNEDSNNVEGVSVQDSFVDSVAVDEESPIVDAGTLNDEDDGTEQVVYIPLETIDTEVVKAEKTEEAVYLPLETLENVEIYSSSSDEKEKQATYISLEEVAQFEETSETEAIEEIGEDNQIGETEEESGEKITKVLVKDGEVQIEFEVIEGEEIEISKKEKLEEENELLVIISSEEHFEEELRVYSTLPFPSEKEKITITWENENEVVSQSHIEYIDENEDSLIERVSWIVPHLSTQTYRIHIQVNGNSSSPTLSLSVVSPFDTNGSVILNPINFGVNVDYVNLTSIECLLEIDEILSILTFDELGANFTGLNLSSGTKNWELYCYDILDSLSNKTILGNFLVQNNLSVSPQTAGKNTYLTGDGFVVNVLANGGTTELKLFGPGGTTHSFSNVSGVNNQVSVTASLLSAVGSYTLVATNYYFESPINYTYNFSIGKINVSFDNSVEEDESVSFNVSLFGLTNVQFDLYVGNVLVQNNYVLSSGSSAITSSFSEGDYEVELRDIQIGGFSYNNREFGNLDVVSSGDSEKPKVELKFPDYEEVITSDTITFVYSSSDNVDVANCTLEIFNSSGSKFYQREELLFPLSTKDKEEIALEKNPSNNSNVDLKLIDFDEGQYWWEVTCIDTSGNKRTNSSYFEVDYGASESSFSSKQDLEVSYERQDEVQELIEKINQYLEDQKTFTLEELAVESALEISKNMNSNKRRLLQFDQDLKYNLDFMEESKRKERVKEIDDEIDKIKEEVVLSLEVVDSYEYQKSSPDIELKTVLTDYLDLTGTEIGKGSLNNLVSLNEELQKTLELKAKIWKVEIRYLDQAREIILVEKDLDFFSEFDEKILEFVPESFDDPTFVTPVQDIGRGIYELNFEDLEVGKLIYYLESEEDLENFEETETLLFEESIPEGSPLTGFFSFAEVGSSFSLFPILLALLLFGFLGLLLFRRHQMEECKKVPGVTALIDLLEEAKKNLELERVDSARENYETMKEIYKALPKNCQEIFYEKVDQTRIAINKKDIMNLVKEYERAKDEFRKEDAEQIYLKINSLYKKLPKKFQERIYRRLVKKEMN